MQASVAENDLQPPCFSFARPGSAGEAFFYLKVVSNGNPSRVIIEASEYGRDWGYDNKVIPLSFYHLGI